MYKANIENINNKDEIEEEIEDGKDDDIIQISENEMMLNEVQSKKLLSANQKISNMLMDAWKRV